MLFFVCQAPSALHTNPELPQTAVLTFTKASLAELPRVFNAIFGRVGAQTVPSLQLVGLKQLSHLEKYQAKEVTPFEVGDAGWKQSLEQLCSGPVLLVVLHGVNAFAVLEPLARSFPVRTLFRCDLSHQLERS